MEANTEEVTSSTEDIVNESDSVHNSTSEDISDKTDENFSQTTDISITDSGRDTLISEKTTESDELDNNTSDPKDLTENEIASDDSQGSQGQAPVDDNIEQSEEIEEEEPSSSGINETSTSDFTESSSCGKYVEGNKENIEAVDAKNSGGNVDQPINVSTENLGTGSTDKAHISENVDLANDNEPQIVDRETPHIERNDDATKNAEKVDETSKDVSDNVNDTNLVENVDNTVAADNKDDSTVATNDHKDDGDNLDHTNTETSKSTKVPLEVNQEVENNSENSQKDAQDSNDTDKMPSTVQNPKKDTSVEADKETPSLEVDKDKDTTSLEANKDATVEIDKDSTNIEPSRDTTGVETDKNTASVEANKDTTIVEANKDTTIVEADKDTTIAEANKDTTIVEADKNAARVATDKDKIVTNEVANKKTAEKSAEAVLNGVVESEQPFEESELISEQGADAEICIIPDTERVISQAEKDAASALPTLRELTESSASAESTSDVPETELIESTSEKFTISKYDRVGTHPCDQCLLDKKPKYVITKTGVTKYICVESCLAGFKTKYADQFIHNEGEIRVKNLVPAPRPVEPSNVSYIRKCACCSQRISNPDTNLAWEIMDFCNQYCLSKYQKEIGSRCSSCNTEVRPNSLGKYCVRFGNDIRQFCSSHCLEEYKKGLKVCSYCQQDISKGSEGFLAPVGDKGHFKDFCSQNCMEKYDIMTNERAPVVEPGTKCCVCQKTDIAIEFEFKNLKNHFCSEPCFVAFSFVNQISAGKCAMCRRNFLRSTLEKHTMFYDNVQHSFCTNSCRNIFIIANRKIVPCNWCKVKKYNFDMIRRYSSNNEVLNMCSVNCYSLYGVSVNAVQAKKITCDFCRKNMQSLYHLTMSDATIRNFCSYACVMSFQSQFPKTPITINASAGVPIVPTSGPKSSKRISQRADDDNSMPVISSVQSLSTANGTVNPVGVSTRATRSKGHLNANTPAVTNNIVDAQALQAIASQAITSQIKQQVLIKPYPVPQQRNVGTLVRTRCYTKATQCTPPTTCDQEVQTEKRAKDKILIPVPVPIYVPAPMHMYTAPTIIPVPIPIPIPVPIFIPTTRNSANGIMKEIKKIQVKIPSDPYEAELLMMAEMVADDKKEENTDSESDIDDNTGGDDGHFSPEPVDASNTFGDDMLQMALKMATELEEPAVDLEGALTANTITAPQGEGTNTEHGEETQPLHLMERQPMRGRKRGMRQGGRNQTPSKRGRRVSNQTEAMPPVQPPPPPEPVEKPDANMCLKFTFGVNAWKQWVTTKNSELEKSSRRVKLFKTEILQLTADELNYSLCLFVKEVRKPNGAEYAPDTIYYLCLGIQQYLFENGRIDNIFCDPYYEKFTDCLDEVARKFSVLYNDSHYIVTRVEEEHLWESKQLGAHSPHVLLSTLMFFNTKHFNLTTVDEHMQLSFSHIMKHWKRNPSQPGAAKVPGSRNVLLRFYPPQSALQNNTRKKKVYEQQENEENPLRCPVKLYEFYLSKCPESVKTRNDVFYLQPERSCVPDSPVWYSTMPLPREALEKMLHRVKMVKEINVALLTS